MSREFSLTAPIDIEKPEVLTQLRYGDRVLISGVIYAARDAAHKKMIETLEKGEQLPFDPKGAVIYYVGPTPRPREWFRDPPDQPLLPEWTHILRSCWIWVSKD